MYWYHMATEYSYAGIKFRSLAMGETGSVRCILGLKLDPRAIIYCLSVGTANL
jgi:hypothetical protein